MRHARSPPYGKIPRYNKLRSMLRDLGTRKDVRYDKVFDWAEHIFALNDMNTNMSV